MKPHGIPVTNPGHATVTSNSLCRYRKQVKTRRVNIYQRSTLKQTTCPGKHVDELVDGHVQSRVIKWRVQLLIEQGLLWYFVLLHYFVDVLQLSRCVRHFGSMNVRIESIEGKSDSFSRVS